MTNNVLLIKVTIGELKYRVPSLEPRTAKDPAGSDPEPVWRDWFRFQILGTGHNRFQI